MPGRGEGSSTEACGMPSHDRHPHRAPAEGRGSHKVLHAERPTQDLRRGGEPLQSHTVPAGHVERSVPSGTDL